MVYLGVKKTRVRLAAANLFGENIDGKGRPADILYLKDLIGPSRLWVANYRLVF
jgi:hypothetical protein